MCKRYVDDVHIIKVHLFCSTSASDASDVGELRGASRRINSTDLFACPYRNSRRLVSFHFYYFDGGDAGGPSTSTNCSNTQEGLPTVFFLYGNTWDGVDGGQMILLWWGGRDKSDLFTINVDPINHRPKT